MSRERTRLPHPRLIIPHRKHVDFESPPSLTGGSLSPDLQPNTPPTFPGGDEYISKHKVSKIGNYLLHTPLDTVVGCIKIYQSFHCDTHEEYVCKVIPVAKYRQVLCAYWRVGSHENINDIEEIILGETQAYVFFARHYGDLHSYVRKKRKLREPEAGRLYRQIVAAVSHCHENGVVLRDLKLRKFVFKDAERTQIKLEGLEDACVLKSDCDKLADKHGCPAYVSPEILNTTDGYSGKAADMWSIGVMLYTILIGRYPFHDTEPSALFTKIRRGQYSIPDTISSRAKCLIRSLLRREPVERLTAVEILAHPWFNSGSRLHGHTSSKDKENSADQAVPDMEVTEEEAMFE